MSIAIGRAQTPLALLAARVTIYPRCGVPDLTGFQEVKGAKIPNVYAYEILDSERERSFEPPESMHARERALNGVAIDRKITHQEASERFEICVVPFPNEKDPDGRTFFKGKFGVKN